ncbi:hypothetical protein ACFPAF_04285 [Hymenobacter endophyticus]|uniref:Uncharacterized protein n=1 Tax=Hymenobacter endophyticus TaxID=3076335 RepID=A0ABU3TE30_9BACT|nr:hypothetical protein [Hymenobacter endophyticus]MDU0369603.1 hypothetical protein [Hymenobacter endophyticus]
MASLTPYQRQFRTRMKRAIRLRASADTKARRYAQKLADALGVGQDAAAQMNALNQLYNVDVSTQTILVHDLQQLITPAQLTTALAGSTPGEELIIFNQVPDGNGGQPLPDNPLFGEAAPGTPIVIVVPSPPQVIDNVPPPTLAREQVDG